MLSQVLGNDAALSQNEFLFLGGIRGIREREPNDGRLPQGVDFPQLTGSLHVLIALEDLDVVGKAELLEQPDDALSAGLIEPVMISAHWCCVRMSK
jgi:hypothetical protein